VLHLSEVQLVRLTNSPDCSLVFISIKSRRGTEGGNFFAIGGAPSLLRTPNPTPFLLATGVVSGHQRAIMV